MEGTVFFSYWCAEQKMNAVNRCMHLRGAAWAIMSLCEAFFDHTSENSSVIELLGENNFKLPQELHKKFNNIFFLSQLYETARLVCFHSAMSQPCTAAAASFICLLSTVKTIQVDLTLCRSCDLCLLFSHFLNTEKNNTMSAPGEQVKGSLILICNSKPVKDKVVL